MSDQFDLFVHGTVFFDVVFTGLESLPVRGTEIQATGMGSCPGGIANLAIAASRLGMSPCRWPGSRCPARAVTPGQ